MHERKDRANMHFKIANGVAEIHPNRSCWIFVFNFAESALRLTKNSVVATDRKIPLSFTGLPDDIGH